VPASRNVQLALVDRAAECQAGGADILAAVPGGYGGMPLVGERGQEWRSVATRGTDHKVHILQRPLERELGCEVAPVHLVELGAGDRRVKRPALDGLRELLVTDTEAIGKLHGFRHTLDEDDM
jgi:hypothetical protein